MVIYKTLTSSSASVRQPSFIEKNIVGKIKVFLPGYNKTPSLKTEYVGSNKIAPNKDQHTQMNTETSSKRALRKFLIEEDFINIFGARRKMANKAFRIWIIRKLVK